MELIPGLPEELALECLTRLPYSSHRLASKVCNKWSKLLKSIDFYYHRKQCGYTRNMACLLQAFFDKTDVEGKPANSPSYGITMFDSVSQTWERLSAVPKYPYGLPLFCRLASCEGLLIVVGGWNPVSYEPVRDVLVYDFTTQQWRQGKDMPSKRSFFAIGAIGSNVYIAGGHDENKNALKSAWAYDVRNDEWNELTQMNQERDECEGVVIGNDFWVVSGYATESQGVFDSSCELYQHQTGEWKKVEGAWTSSLCPKSCVGLGRNGDFISWSESNSLTLVGVCGILLGSTILVTGSEYKCGGQLFYAGEVNEGKIGKLENWRS